MVKNINIEDWERPVPFLTAPTSFDVGWLPPPLNDYVSAVAESSQTPVDMAAISLLSVLGLCNSRNFLTQVSQDYYEPLNLYCVVVAEPSARKSTVLREITAPVVSFEEERNKGLAPEIARSTQEKEFLFKELAALERAAIKNTVSRDEVYAKAIELAKFEELKPLRLLVDDITMEKLTSLLCDNEGKLGVFSGEGQIFSIFSGQYSGTYNFDVILKGYTGEDLRVDRVGRESEFLKNPALSMLLAIQPSVLKDVIGDKNFQGRGLISRILFSVPELKIGHRSFETTPIPVRLKSYYENLIKNLLSKEYDKAIPLKLTDDGKAELKNFFDGIEKRLNHDLFELRAFAGKVPGLVCRIAGNLHCAKYPNTPESQLISSDTMRSAIRIGYYALDHANIAMSVSNYSSAGSCKYIIEQIKLEGEVNTITKRELFRLCRRYKYVKELEPYIQDLVTHKYLSPADPNNIGRGRPSEIYHINPYIHIV